MNRRAETGEWQTAFGAASECFWMLKSGHFCVIWMGVGVYRLGRRGKEVT